MTVSIIVATFGPRAVWDPLAARALASAEAQTVPVEVVRHHIDDPDQRVCGRARNEAIARASGEWLVILDADDELAANYVERMLEADGDIRVPARSVLHGDVWSPPELVRRRPMSVAPWVLIGAMHRRTTWERLGGFREDVESQEDKDYWLRADMARLKFVEVPGAVYRVHNRPGSRKRHPGRDAIWRQILREARGRKVA